ncbi:MAG: phage tail protein [Wolbachia endosymbiont of Fragariocoptes setiger]|nr:phage tail protein [Wolbachia endosymbiont of Fragariocoptes setiger]
MLLPPNSTKQERALVDAINYQVDLNCIKGFKLKYEEKILPWLIEEYGLEEILFWVKDKKKAVKEGVKFQRLKGTPASLKIALKWANIEDITIIEEPPFAEFQVGICCNIPNDSLVNTVIDLAKLAAPARSRLMRIFNDLYNAQRFILNESLFGDLLSDYSGTKIAKEGPVLSFGRKNSFELKLANPSFKFGTFRAHYERSYSNDLYRLDVAILGDTEPHTKNYSGIYERDHLWYNFKALYPLPQSLLPAIKFAKAQIILSDSWKLGEVNGCFSVSYHEEAGDKFLLGNDKLSEQLCSFKYTPILERFSINYQYEAKNFDDQKAIKYGLAEHYTCLESNLNQNQDGPTHELENHILVFYSGVIVWHEHKHLNRSWNNTQPITLIY